MAYSIPQNKDSFLKLCSESGTSFPYSDDISCLAKEITVAGKKINNRIVYQAMEGCDGTYDGAPDELTYRRYLRFARGGAGIIWFEATAVLPEGRANPRQMYLSEKTEDELKKIVCDIKETGIKENGFEPVVIVQL
ncbi:MAG: flavin oxidoreductase/NADH oxidase, partial [Clostridia bacterium]|nr:flavin oxidoreductase/NADH oxidase [Clostridia bacterium]